jgi:hypothetical protein
MNEWRMKASNQSMKPTSVNKDRRQAAPLRNKLRVFATTPSISSRCPASLVRFAASHSRTRRIVIQR